MTATASPPRPAPPRAAGPAPGTPAARAPRPTAGGVANLALALLTLAATYGLARLLNRPGHFFAPVALVGAAVHLTAWACRRWNVALPASALVCALVTIVTTSWLALGHTTAYGVPWRGTYHALGPLLQAAADAYRTTAAPTAVIPGFVVAGAVGAACIAFLADWAAFRMRATTEAVLPSFSLFVLSAALAQGHEVVTAGALWLAALLVFLLVRQSAVESPATAWFASRSRRGPTSVLAVGGAMTVATVALAATIGPHLPGATVHPVVNWRHASSGGGGSGRNTASPLVDLAARLRTLDQQEVFTVQTTQPSYLRITALSTFNGTGWSLDDTYRPVHGALPAADRGTGALPADADTTEPVTATFRVSALESLWLPTVYRPVRVSGIGGLSYSAAAGSIISDKPTSDGLTYTVVSAAPAPSPGQLAATKWVSTERADLKKYLALPSSVPSAVRALAVAHTRGATNPYQAARMLQDWLRNPPFQYSLKVPDDQSSNALLDFLTRSQAGFCQQFAASFAVLAREVGLPTRVAVGFTPGDPDRQGVYHVRDADSHAWPEVWFDGVGWLAFEPTPGRGSPDPGAEAITGALPGQAAAGTTPTTQASAPAVVPTTPSTVAGSHISAGPRPAGATSHHQSWGAAILATVIGLAGAAAAWVVLLAGLSTAIGRRRRRLARSPAARVSLAWSVAREACASAGLPAHAWETPAEFAARAGAAPAFVAGASVAVARLADLEERASYSVTGPGPGDVEAALQAATEVRRAARAAGGRRRRLWHSWDPRPVVASMRAARDEARIARELVTSAG